MKIFSILLLSLFLIQPLTADAVAIVSFPFGGKIVFEFPCDCKEVPGSAVLYIYNGGFSYTVVKYIPFVSTLYLKDAPYYTSNVVGRYTVVPSQQCSYIAGYYCSQFSVINRVQMLGTSLPEFFK